MLYHSYLKKASGIIMTGFMLSVTASGESLWDMMEKASANAAYLGSKLTIKSLTDALFSGITDSMQALMLSFGISLAIISVNAVFSAIKQGFSQNEAIFDNIGICLTVLSTAYPLTSCFALISENLEALCGYMAAFIPTSVMLYRASGCTLTAAASSVTGPLAVTCIQSVCVSVVLPITKAICSLTFISSLCKKTDFSGFLSLLKSASLWITGLSFTLFTGVLSLQSLLQSGIDSLTLKGLKFGASRLIPIAGGFVSESMRTVISGVSFIKSTVGIAGIVFIIYSIIPPLCIILTAKLSFSLLSAFAKATYSDKTAQIYSSLTAALNILLSLVIGCSAAFIIVFSVFMKTNVSI